MVRVTRRQFLSTAAILIGTSSIAVATGCAPAATPTTAPAAPKPAEPTKAPEAAKAAEPTKAPEAAKPAEVKPTEAAKPAAAPAAAIKGTSLAFIGGTYFVAPAQELFKKQIETWGKDNGVTVSADFMNWPDLQAKIAAAIASGSGADCVELWPVWNFLYKDALLEVGDIAETVEKGGGGWTAYVGATAKVGGKYLSIPHGNTNGGINIRTSWFKEAGADVSKGGKGLDLTWDDFFALGKKLKAAGHPIGQGLGHSLGDPPGMCYPFMWSYGAMEVEKDGKTVAFNKPEFVDGMKKFIQGWKDGFDPTGLSWDDSNNNRAFLAGQISATYNGSSIYVAAKKEQPKIAEDMDHMLMPKGPSGRFYQLGTKSMAIMKKTKNPEGAKAFWKWWFDDKQFGEWFRLQEGYYLANTIKYENDPMWDKDPKIWAFKEQSKYGRDQGFAGDPGEKSSLAWSKYIVVDTFAKAIQGGDAESAIKWGADELKKIYG